MFICPEPDAGCRLALELIEHFDSDETLPPVHIGLAFGPLVTMNGDYFGDAVNVAGRLHDLAPASKVLIDSQLAEASRESFALDDVTVWFPATDLEGPIHELRAPK
jgi:adenylate cyclase